MLIDPSSTAKIQVTLGFFRGNSAANPAPKEEGKGVVVPNSHVVEQNGVIKELWMWAGAFAMNLGTWDD